MLDYATLLPALRRHWEYAGKDEDVSHEVYHDDAVLEFLQSGERFADVKNFRECRRQYPARLKFHTRRITHRDDLVVVENIISYDGAPWMFAVNLLELRGDRVAHERIYIMDDWEAPEWRVPWRAEWAADLPPPLLYPRSLRGIPAESGDCGHPRLSNSKHDGHPLCLPISPHQHD